MELEVHPPERRRRSLVLACGGCGCGCCCCCCCCLHSVGGLVGAGIPSVVTLVRGAPTKRSGLTYLRCKKCRSVTTYGPEALQGPTVTCPTCGTLGAVPEPRPALEKVDAVTALEEARSRRVAVGYFWALSVLISVPFLLAGEEFAIGLAMLLPLAQLAAALASFVAIALTPRALVSQKRVACGSIGWILLGVFLGTVIGTLLMLPIFGIALVKS